MLLELDAALLVGEQPATTKWNLDESSPDFLSIYITNWCVFLSPYRSVVQSSIHI